MSEHFNISIITDNTANSIESLENCIRGKISIPDKASVYKFLNGRKVLVRTIEDDGIDYCEIYISIPDQIFHKEIFENELEIFTEFINSIFECDSHVKYALCSYEINGNILSQVYNLDMFNDELLNRFPIAYKRMPEVKFPFVYCNLQAQDIFSVM